MCQTSSHDKTRHRRTQQKRLRGHGGPGGVSLYWRQRRSQLRMEAWIQCGFWGHLRCGLGRIANSSATIGDHGNATRLHSRLFPPNGGRFGSVVAGGRDRVPGALFPFFLSIFLTTRMECSAALFLIARRSDEVRGRAGPRGMDCIVDAEWTTDVRWRLSGPPTGGWREPSARERKLRNAMPRLGRVWRSMPRGTAVNLQPWSVEC